MVWEFPLDSTPDPLETKLLPLGDSVADTVALVCAEVLEAHQADVKEEDFAATQARVMAAKQPTHPPTTKDPKVLDSKKFGIDLDAKGNREEEDKEQEVPFFGSCTPFF